MRSIATTAMHFVAAIVAFGAIPAATHAVEMSQPITPSELNRQIAHVLHDDKYYWVNQSAGQPAAEPAFGPLRLFANLIDEGWAGVVKGIKAAMHWLRQLFQRPPASDRPPRPGRAHVSIWLLACLAVMALGAAGALILRGRGRLVAKVLPGSAVPATVDLYKEQVLATELPEHEWIALARNCLQHQELRLAVRALYLAALAALARQEFLTITPYKTNADYRQELRRRSHSMPAVEVFARNGRQYESVWYGLHEPSPEIIQAFEQDVQQLRNVSHV